MTIPWSLRLPSSTWSYPYNVDSFPSGMTRLLSSFVALTVGSALVNDPAKNGDERHFPLSFPKGNCPRNAGSQALRQTFQVFETWKVLPGRPYPHSAPLPAHPMPFRTWQQSGTLGSCRCLCDRLSKFQKLGKSCLAAPIRIQRRYQRIQCLFGLGSSLVHLGVADAFATDFPSFCDRLSKFLKLGKSCLAAPIRIQRRYQRIQCLFGLRIILPVLEIAVASVGIDLSGFKNLTGLR